MGSFIGICASMLALAALYYAYAVIRYKRGQYSVGNSMLPPIYPATVPILSNLLSYMIDSRDFFRRATISFMWFSIYAFQDRDSVRKIMSHPSLSSPMPMYLYCMKYLFGMPDSGLNAYKADDSGPLSKPYAGSHVKPEHRIDFGLHQGYVKGLSGPGLTTTAQRIFQGVYQRFEAKEQSLSHEWANVPDIYGYFQTDLSSAVIQALFGSLILEMHPDIVDDLWRYDDLLPWLAKGVPSWIYSEPYRSRDQICAKLKAWHANARNNFDKSMIFSDGDGDPCWGSELTRERHQLLKYTHDDDALASSDLGFMWAVIANTVPSILYTVMHIFKDPNLLPRIREEVSERFRGDIPAPEHVKDLKALQNMPLLESAYAETLRLYVKTWVMVSSAHDDVDLGRWRLPRGCIGVINSDVSHMDKSFWNTQDGRHPVDEFWAERFLIDPNDPSSGPINPGMHSVGAAPEPGQNKDKPYFSRAGLMGSWMPYGGGPSICPGRHLAKYVIFYVASLLVSKFDIELQDDRNTITLDAHRFGLGVGRPPGAIPIRVRKRKVVS
ncbi:cytochrome P450 [Nemania sp. FL0916]|nr:cytochrome P450 [Nemania sp. FL0916]